jgi:hypothetical protein
VTSAAPHRRRPHHTARALLALIVTAGALVGVLAAIAYGNPDVQVVQPVATESAASVVVEEPPVEERNIAPFGAGVQLRADHEFDSALAAAAQQAEQEAAAAAAAQAAADEQAAADAAAEAHAEEVAALEYAAALAEQEAAAAPPVASQPAPPPAVQGDPFDALAQCESGRNPNAYNPSGPYYGAFQFHPGTWNSYAPDMPGVPTDYSYAQQKVVAQRLQAARGWSPWPSCARQLGLM